MSITYLELMKLVSYGLFSMNFKGISINDKRLSKCKLIKGADYNGIYVGSPGRDIYYMLPYLSDEQIKNVVVEFEKKFPIIPPGNHVNVAACIRFIYGQFEKQGILRSEKDFKRMKKEKLNWDLSRKFLDILYNQFKKNKNYYGLTMLCEMNAHRLGDEAVINKDEKKLIEMEKLYLKSVKYSHKCKSYKHMFTPYYWAFGYFRKFNKVKNSLFYSYLTVEEASKYCPDARPGYIEKILDCVEYVKKHDKNKWNDFLKLYKNSKNKCIKKVFKKIK